MNDREEYLLTTVVKALKSSFDNYLNNIPYYRDEDMVRWFRWNCNFNDREIKDFMNLLNKLNPRDTLLLSKEKLGDELVKNKTESYDDLLKIRTFGYRLMFGNKIVVREDECNFFSETSDEMKEYITESVKRGLFEYLENHFEAGDSNVQESI